MDKQWLAFVIGLLGGFIIASVIPKTTVVHYDAQGRIVKLETSVFPPKQPQTQAVG